MLPFVTIPIDQVLGQARSGGQVRAFFRPSRAITFAWLCRCGTMDFPSMSREPTPLPCPHYPIGPGNFACGPATSPGEGACRIL